MRSLILSFCLVFAVVVSSQAQANKPRKAYKPAVSKWLGTNNGPTQGKTVKATAIKTKRQAIRKNKKN